MVKELLCLLPIVGAAVIGVPNRASGDQVNDLNVNVGDNTTYNTIDTFDNNLDFMYGDKSAGYWTRYSHDTFAPNQKCRYYRYQSYYYLDLFNDYNTYVDNIALNQTYVRYLYNGINYYVAPMFEITNRLDHRDSSSYFNFMVGTSFSHGSSIDTFSIYYHLGGTNTMNLFDDYGSYTIFVDISLMSFDELDLYGTGYEVPFNISKKHNFSSAFNGVEYSSIYTTHDYLSILSVDLVLVDLSSVSDDVALGWYDTGYNDGYNSGYTTGYDTGYIAGGNSASNLGGNVATLLFNIADLPIYILKSLFSFDLFGISVFTAIMSIITATLLFWIIRKFI